MGSAVLVHVMNTSAFTMTSPLPHLFQFNLIDPIALVSKCWILSLSQYAWLKTNSYISVIDSTLNFTCTSGIHNS